MIFKKKKWEILLLSGFIILCSFFICFQFFKKLPFTRIPLIFNNDGIPYVLATINKKSYRLALDLGASSAPLLLNKKKLHKLKSQSIGAIDWIDINGKEYHSLLFPLPEVRIGKVKFWKVIAAEEDPTFLVEGGLLWNQTPNYHADIFSQGRLGLKILQAFPMLIDLSNSVLYFLRGVRSFPYLEKEGYFLSQWATIPFEFTRCGIVFTVNSEYGPIRLLLDSGASFGLLRPSIVNRKESDEFFAANRTNISIQKLLFNSAEDLGPIEFSLYNFSDELDCDGILGVNFLSRVMIYLDFQRCEARIKSS